MADEGMKYADEYMGGFTPAQKAKVDEGLGGAAEGGSGRKDGQREFGERSEFGGARGSWR